MTKHHILYWVLFITLANPPMDLIAQSSKTDFPIERIVIQTDRFLYITGETVWFKLFAYNETDHLSDFSRVAYLELIDDTGTAVSRIKVGLERAQGTGAIELPPGLNSGYYTLRAYTQAMRNLGVAAFCHKQLIVLHPEQPVVQPVSNRAQEGRSRSPAAAAQQSSVGNEKLKVSIQPVKQQFGQREQIQLEVATTDEAGRPVAADVSLAVALSAPPAIDPANEKQATTAPPTSLTFPSEEKGMQLRGRLSRQSDGSPVDGEELFLAFPGKTARVYTEISDPDGGFSFALPKLYGLQAVVLQTGPNTTAPLAIELEEAFHEIPPVTAEAFVLPAEWLPLANASMINAQIRQSYRAFEKPPVFATQDTFEDVPFFGSADVQYRLDDYNRFPLPEFFYEIVLEVQVRGKFGEENISLINKDNNPLAAQPPLLLVDGVPVFDQRTFLKINNRLIASVEIVKSPFWLNPRFYNGIVQLSSFEGDARVFELPETALRRTFLTLLPQRRFTAPDHSVKPDDSLPDFRNTLHWDPSIRTGETGRAVIEFFSSDAIGDYTIEATAVSEDGKFHGSKRELIQIVKKRIE
jgi:hypothetical protein